MTRMTRSVVSIVFVAGCGFRGPDGGGPDAGRDAATDAATDATPDTAPDTMPIAWLDGWARRKEITLKASEIDAPGNGALTDFPVLVSVTDTQIAATALAAGTDIVFTGGDAMTMLASEVESFTPGTGQLVAWVKVPSLSATTDTKLYVYYGNPSPPAPAPEMVWTANYLGVWHFHQDPTGGNDAVRDATSGDHDGTAQQMEANDSVTAQIGRGLNFDGNNEYVDFGQVNVGNALTISMWVRIASGSGIKTLIANSNSGRDENGFKAFVNTVNTTDRRLFFESGDGTTGSGDVAVTNVDAITQNVFAHVAFVVNRMQGTAQIYVNGAKVDVDMSIGANFLNNSDFEIGRMENNLFYFDGILDEVRIATAQRPAEWLKTSFNNQSQPGNFHTFGPEERKP